RITRSEMQNKNSAEQRRQRRIASSETPLRRRAPRSANQLNIAVQSLIIRRRSTSQLWHRLEPTSPNSMTCTGSSTHLLSGKRDGYSQQTNQKTYPRGFLRNFTSSLPLLVKVP